MCMLTVGDREVDKGGAKKKEKKGGPYDFSNTYWFYFILLLFFFEYPMVDTVHMNVKLVVLSIHFLEEEGMGQM